MTEPNPAVAILDDIAARYEIVHTPDFVALHCRRCVTVLLNGTGIDTQGQITQNGLTLADLVEQAAEHEADMHLGDQEPDQEPDQ